MLTKLLKPSPHWIDYNLFSTLALNDEAHAEKIGIITDNLNEYLVPFRKENPYSLTINLYACADNPQLFHLIADINVFQIEKIHDFFGGKTFNPTKTEGAFRPQTPGVLVATHTVQGPPPPPPPPPPRIFHGTNFITIGEQYNLVKSSFSIPTTFANVFRNYTTAL